MVPRRVDPSPREPLPRGFLLDGRFVVEKKIGEGTFSAFRVSVQAGIFYIKIP